MWAISVICKKLPEVKSPNRRKFAQSWIDVMIFKMFSPKNLVKMLAFLLKLLLVFAKILIIALVFEKNANFFAENWQKSQKIVIITSTPGHPGLYAASMRWIIQKIFDSFRNGHCSRRGYYLGFSEKLNDKHLQSINHDLM
jgi:hypothetical protein